MTAENITELQTEALLAAVRNHLDITWSDEALDVKLTGFLKRGITRLNDLSGTECNFSEEGSARDLLFERCRYYRSNAGDQFEKNYQSEIIALRLKQGVAQYEADNPII